MRISDWSSDVCSSDLKLVRVFFSVTAFSPKGKGDANERVLKSVYRAAGWDLLDDRYLQIMGLLCAMPMTMANGLSRDLERMKRMRTLLTTTAANLAPIQGEFLGGQVPHLMLIGRDRTSPVSGTTVSAPVQPGAPPHLHQQT